MFKKCPLGRNPGNSSIEVSAKIVKYHVWNHGRRQRGCMRYEIRITRVFSHCPFAAQDKVTHPHLEQSSDRADLAIGI